MTKRSANPLSGPVDPGALSQTEQELRAAFLAETNRIPGGARLDHCIQCGSCTGSCPVSYAMDLTPRQLIGMFRAGAIEELLESRTIWVCASCYQCTTRCPADIQITDLIYAFRRIAMETGIFPKRFPTYVFSEAFIAQVRRYGRNFESGLLAEYFLRTKPQKALGYTRAGVALVRHGRIRVRPQKIKDIDGLRRIIAKAETFDLPQESAERKKVTDTVGYDAIGGAA
ncbi:MAG: 4Fe-4S dicluster domain-containing protein [Actinomycetota bacterium]|nr:4Fe-4S dicluster domain-containing protein [Actinomycetota bacterium]